MDAFNVDPVVHFKMPCAADGSSGRSERAEDMSLQHWNRLISLIPPFVEKLHSYSSTIMSDDSYGNPRHSCLELKCIDDIS